MLYTILILNLKSSTFEAATFEGPHERVKAFSAAKAKFPHFDDRVNFMMVAIMPGRHEIVLPGEFIIERNSSKPKKLSSI